MDAIRDRIGRYAVGFATTQLDRARSVSVSFKSLAEKDQGD
jgi:hypothetical protein